MIATALNLLLAARSQPATTFAPAGAGEGFDTALAQATAAPDRRLGAQDAAAAWRDGAASRNPATDTRPGAKRDTLREKSAREARADAAGDDTSANASDSPTARPEKARDQADSANADASADGQAASQSSDVAAGAAQNASTVAPADAVKQTVAAQAMGASAAAPGSSAARGSGGSSAAAGAPVADAAAEAVNAVDLPLARHPGGGSSERSAAGGSADGLAATTAAATGKVPTLANARLGADADRANSAAEPAPLDALLATLARDGQATGPTASAAGGTADASAASTAPATPDDGNVARVARGLQSAVNQQGGTVTLRLEPPELGVVRIQMEMQNGVVRVQFNAEQTAVRDLLAHQMSQLRHALEGQGLVVDRLEVQTLPAHPAGSAPEHGLGESGDDGRSRGQYGQGQQGSTPQSEEPAEVPATFQELIDTVA